MAVRKGQDCFSLAGTHRLQNQFELGGSHKILERIGWPDYVFAFHDNVEIGPRMPARIAKHTGLTPSDL